MSPRNPSSLAPPRLLVLASASPRRCDLLGQIGLQPVVDAPEVDETPRPRDLPGPLVARLARAKAEAVAQRQPGAAVLAADTAGINGVPWDAVELPSQFMEQYAWRAEVLPLVSGHFETREPLPHEMLARLQASRTFQAGMQTVRQLEFALFDFRLHAEFAPGAPSRINETLAEVREAVAVVRPPEYNRFPHSFQHVFSGGYAAGYYRYKWAEVLSADAFGAFEERGVFDTATARPFLGSILERGGSRDAMEAFVEFRGRKPELEPLLRQLGLAA